MAMLPCFRSIRRSPFTACHPCRRIPRRTAFMGSDQPRGHAPRSMILVMVQDGNAGMRPSRSRHVPTRSMMPNPIRSDRTHHAGHARPTAAHAHGRPVRRAAVWSSASDGRCHRFSMSPPSVRCQRMTSGVTEAMGSRPRTAACTGVATPVHANEPVIAPPIAIPARYSMYWMSSIGIGMRHRMRSRVRIRSRRDDMGFRPFSHDPACRPSKRMSGRVGAGRETRACAADSSGGCNT